MWKLIGYSPIIVLSWSEGYHLPRGTLKSLMWSTELRVSSLFPSLTHPSHTNRVHWAAHIQPSSPLPYFCIYHHFESFTYCGTFVLPLSSISEDLMHTYFPKPICLALTFSYIAVRTWMLFPPIS